MATGELADQVKRWKLIALVCAFIAVASVAGLIGWIARGASATVTTTFTGGGTTTGDACDNQYTARRLAVGTSVKILSGSGTELATGKIISGPEYLNSGCRQRFVVDGIPLGRGVYLIEIGRWRGTTTEAELRSNTTDILLT